MGPTSSPVQGPRAAARSLLRIALWPACVAGVLALPAAAQQPSGLPAQEADRIDLGPLDLQTIKTEDIQREREGLPPRYAVPHEVSITPWDRGSWVNLDAETVLWRLRVSSPGALSLNLGFTRYWLPPHASLVVHAVGQTQDFQAYDANDDEEHGELWTPVVLSDDLIVELTVPLRLLDQVDLRLGAINVGYRFFGEKDGGVKSGSCNIDVICPEGDAWRDEISAVGVISTGGSTFCTGFMVNNTAQDEKPYFMTANHCGINTSNAASLVVYWNFESPVCGQHGGGSLADSQTGSYFRASFATSDFTLVELDSDPDPLWEVSFAGWERGSANPTSAVGIHHPNTDEKSISFENDPLETDSYLGTTPPGDGSHLRIIDWDVGTTEPGSSGSPLFDQNHHVVGQLHGGYAACGNDLSDWYGRFSMSWDGGGSNATRLSNWLDPLATGATSVDTYVPGATGLRVTPSTVLEASGDVGGPFTPSSIVYTLENRGATPFTYAVSATQGWVSVTNGAGSLAGGATTNVTVAIGAAASALPAGLYSDVVSFVNVTTHEGDTARAVKLQVGLPVLAYSFPMDSDPHWTLQGDWAFGQPLGGGGAHGNPDPTSGHTGPYVLGYNLAGDYTNSMPERNLTSGALDCSDLAGVELRFWRWLDVETPTYDHAYVRVSNDGVNWTQVWANTDYIEDSSWSQQSYDISAVADGHGTVYLRWTMGTTDSSWTYCGWNIDDVELWGLDLSTDGSYCTPKVSSSGCIPSIGATGTPSATAPSGYLVSVEQVEPNRIGLLFYSTTGPAGSPFQGGFLCVQAPLVRTPAQNSGNGGSGLCPGLLTLDMNAAGYCASVGAGNQVWMQAWFRDPPAATGTGLSNGLTFTVQP